MKLTEKWSIEKESTGFALLEKREVEERKDGIKTGVKKEAFTKSYYGTVYQALRGFLVKASQEEQDLYDSGVQISALLNTLEEAEAEIKKRFCTEVKVVK